jgi:hypothetical protein
MLGWVLGLNDGEVLGLLLGLEVGSDEGAPLGTLLAFDDGTTLGLLLGLELGSDEGAKLSTLLGSSELQSPQKAPLLQNLPTFAPLLNCQEQRFWLKVLAP